MLLSPEAFTSQKNNSCTPCVPMFTAYISYSVCFLFSLPIPTMLYFCTFIILQVVNPIPEVVAAVPLTLPNGKSLPSFAFKPTCQAETKRTSARNEMVVTLLYTNVLNYTLHCKPKTPDG